LGKKAQRRLFIWPVPEAVRFVLPIYKLRISQTQTLTLSYKIRCVFPSHGGWQGFSPVVKGDAPG